MNSQHLLDPELAALVAFMPRLDLSTVSLATVRMEIAAIAATAREFNLPGIDVSERFIPCPHGPVIRALVYTPTIKIAGSRSALLHIHGGGMVLGCADLSHAANLQRAQDLDCVVVSIDYRLAPETVWPGQLHDCYSSLLWLAQNAADLGIDSNRIAILGESAGGGLSAATCLHAREAQQIRPCLQVLLYPMLDDRTGATAPANPFVGDYVWSLDNNRFGWRCLLGEGNNVMPAHVSNLVGLPPAFIAVGALDLFLDENLRYGQRLLMAGVSTELHVYPGAVHAFDQFAHTRLAQQLRGDVNRALLRAFDKN